MSLQETYFSKKQLLVNKLSDKGVSANVNNGLTTLINKIDDIETVPDMGTLRLSQTFVGVPEDRDVNGLIYRISNDDYSKIVYYGMFNNGLLQVQLPVGRYTVAILNAPTLISGYSLDRENTVASSTVSILENQTSEAYLFCTYEQNVNSLDIELRFMIDGNLVQFNELCEFFDPGTITLNVNGSNGFNSKLLLYDFSDGRYTIDNVPLGQVHVIISLESIFIDPNFNLNPNSDIYGATIISQQNSGEIVLTVMYNPVQ